jgi:hypothetical protein
MSESAADFKDEREDRRSERSVVWRGEEHANVGSDQFQESQHTTTGGERGHQDPNEFRRVKMTSDRARNRGEKSV